MSGKIRILSIDGGGIRGIIPAVILNYIEKGLQRQSGDANVTIADYFDLVAGTSTGGILACYYLLPPLPGQGCHSRYFASDAVDMYARHGKNIFNRKFLRNGIAREKYSASGLEKALKDCMGDVTLAETRKNCLITAYDVTERKAVFFTSPEARKYEHRNYLMRDVARATSAAPTYFELAAIRSMGGTQLYLIDGAVFAGNPTMCAVVEAKPHPQPLSFGEGRSGSASPDVKYRRICNPTTSISETNGNDILPDVRSGIANTAQPKENDLSSPLHPFTPSPLRTFTLSPTPKSPICMSFRWEQARKRKNTITARQKTGAP